MGVRLFLIGFSLILSRVLRGMIVLGPFGFPKRATRWMRPIRENVAFVVEKVRRWAENPLKDNSIEILGGDLMRSKGRGTLRGHLQRSYQYSITCSYFPCPSLHDATALDPMERIRLFDYVNDRYNSASQFDGDDVDEFVAKLVATIDARLLEGEPAEEPEASKFLQSPPRSMS